MCGEAAPQTACAPVAAGGTVSNASALLAECIRLDALKKAAKKELEQIEDELFIVKEQIKDLFAEMGVSSMRSGKKNLYLSKQIWAGINENVDKKQIADILASMDMADFITIGTQKLSGYVRERITEHPEFYNENGEITASPEDILAALPEPFNTMLRVSEKIDIRVRN